MCVELVTRVFEMALTLEEGEVFDLRVPGVRRVLGFAPGLLEREVIARGVGVLGAGGVVGALATEEGLARVCTALDHPCSLGGAQLIKARVGLVLVPDVVPLVLRTAAGNACQSGVANGGAAERCAAR